MTDAQDNPQENAPGAAGHGASRTQDEVALELMKFLTQQTGFGKSSQTAAGFSGKPAPRSAEEQVDTLLALFERCRKAVKQDL